MKKLNSFFLLCFLCLACQDKKQSETALKVGDDNNTSWFSFGGKENEYKVDKITITLQPKGVDELLVEHHFDSDSIRKVYLTLLSKNYYFLLKLEPESNEIGLPLLDENRLKENSYMVICEDTIETIETSQLHDFGMSKSKSLLLVFPKTQTRKDCDIEVVSVGGAISRFDRYDFQIDSE